MELYPAIDVRGGRVARVPPGHPDDPMTLLEAWGAAGARWVHLVDLDRAYRTGENDAVIRRLIQAAGSPPPGGGRGVRIQVGGGLASISEIEAVLEWGASRVVVGVPLAADHDALGQLAVDCGADRLAIALEVKDGRLAPRAGTAPPGLGVQEYVKHARQQGIRTLIHTDVTRDGSLGGPDLDGARHHARGGALVIVGGGVGTLEDLRGARGAGLAGVIVGRALHDGRFTLAQALACLA